MKKTRRLSRKRKSELCLQCGKCCMSMTFYGGEVDHEARDEIHWMELHGFAIEYVERKTRTEYYFTIPQRCNALQEVKAGDGRALYMCGVYETRPQMCKDYDGRMAGPFGVKDCLWRLETPAARGETLVQLRRS